MEIKKVSSNSVSKDTVITDKNLKLECVGDECHIVAVSESLDEETALVLDDAEKETTKTEEKAETKTETANKT